MKIPKKIENLIRRREKLAASLQMVNFDLDEWLDKNEIEVEPYDYRGGVELYVNPSESAERVREAIESKEK